MSPESTEKLPVLKNFSQRLGYVVALSGAKDSHLARRIKVSRGYISKLRAGTSENPSVEFCNKCAGVFGIDAEWLRNGVGETPKTVRKLSLYPEPTEQSYGMHDAPRGQSSFDAVAGLSDEQLVQIITGLANELQTATGEARFKKIMSLSIHANALLVRATEAAAATR